MENFILMLTHHDELTGLALFLIHPWFDSHSDKQSPNQAAPKGKK
jgi:hypothetical protein